MLKYLKRYSGCGDSLLWADKWFDLYITWSCGVCYLTGVTGERSVCCLSVSSGASRPTWHHQLKHKYIIYDLPTCRQPKPNLRRKPSLCKLELSQNDFRNQLRKFPLKSKRAEDIVVLSDILAGIPRRGRRELYAYLAAAAVVSFFLNWT